MLELKDKELGYRVELRGRDIHVYRLRVSPEKYLLRKALGVLAKWDFVRQEVEVHFDGAPDTLVQVCNDEFGKRLRALEPQRQQGLFENGCSVCGNDRNTFPETVQKDQFDNVVTVYPDEPVRWECQVCSRLVCRKCTLVGPSGRYYHHTYCSEACRAANPLGWDDEDDMMDVG